MALRATITPLQEERQKWPYHREQWRTMPASTFMGGDRRLEAENYLASGHGIRLAIQARKLKWEPLSKVARVMQPSRLKGILVSSTVGTPFLAATQVFDIRPIPRKWLALARTGEAETRFVSPGAILVTRSGNVGRATLALDAHVGVIISDDLLRVEATRAEDRGWVYAFLRSANARAMMLSAQYGHIIKHLEVGHLTSIPCPVVPEAARLSLSETVDEILRKRNEAYDLFNRADRLYERVVGSLPAQNLGTERGFTVHASNLFRRRRRLEGTFHDPLVERIRMHLRGRHPVESLAAVQCSVWMPTRFRRIAAEKGAELLDSSDLFEINPDKGRTIADGDFGDPYQGRVEEGWLLVARSGQVYGLNGSVAMSTKFHLNKVVSDDVIRVRPPQGIRAGYLYVCLTHPTLGRPLLKSLIYGSSIPHLDVGDVATIEFPRCGERIESDIADLAEDASNAMSDADLLERQIAATADELIERFISG